MKRIILFFAVCLGLSGIWTDGFCATNTSRTASKRANANTATIADKNLSRTTVKTRSGTARTQNRSQQKTVQSRQQNKSVKQRASTPTVKSRQSTIARTTTSRQAKNTTATVSRGAASKTMALATRATELNQDKIDSIKSKDYSKCKTVFFDCMDEFCANKDSNLRRCACSSRIHEFDGIKKQLSAAEDKMLDFNQHLLTVTLSKEDAAAINVASEGEQGYYDTKDKSESEKMLKKITDALNSSGNSKLNNSLSSVSLSLNVDSAWDSVDSMAGIATTSKSGVDLYNAARPVCIEMAKEVCSDDELSVVQSSYQLSIQQDCNTVAKSYSTQYNQAKEKIYESSALLDMARLNVYQKNNSDDVLTCKRKILEQLSDTTVCGTNLYKCLDTTGQYINPSTGAAFLSPNLHNLTNLLIAPTGDLTWAKVPQNDGFVKFLNSKRAYLKTAVSQCREMADVVWDDFVNDALSQIKLAQNAKLEEIRQSCTTLVAQCKIGAQESLNDFDTRALSTFNVLSDTTVNKMCEQIQTACTSLMESSGGGADEWNKGMTNISVDTSYSKILETCMVAGKDCIIQKCNGTSGNFALCQDYSSTPRRNILNRNACWKDVYDCVAQSGNVDKIKPFYVQGMADDLPIADRREQFYKANYWINSNNVPKSIKSTITYLTGNDGGDAEYAQIPTFCDNDDIACLITEQLWGNCHYSPSGTAITTNTKLVNDTVKTFNTILTPLSGQTLLSWFADQTGTTNTIDSCSAYSCPINYQYDINNGRCSLFVSESAEFTYFTGASHTLTTMADLINTINGTNYCPGGNASLDTWKNCCRIDVGNDESYGKVTDNYVSGTRTKICVPNRWKAIFIREISCNDSFVFDTSSGSPTILEWLCGSYTQGANGGRGTTYTHDASTLYRYNMYCVLPENRNMSVTNSNNQTLLNCDGGHYVFIDQYGNYINPVFLAPGQQSPYRLLHVRMFYQTKKPEKLSATDPEPLCVYGGNDTTEWKKVTFDLQAPGILITYDNVAYTCQSPYYPTHESFIIVYPNAMNSN